MGSKRRAASVSRTTSVPLCDARMNPQLTLEQIENGHHWIRATHSVDIVQESANRFPEQLTPHSFERRVLRGWVHAPPSKGSFKGKGGGGGFKVEGRGEGREEDSVMWPRGGRGRGEGLKGWGLPSSPLPPSTLKRPLPPPPPFEAPPPPLPSPFNLQRSPLLPPLPP